MASSEESDNETWTIDVRAVTAAAHIMADRIQAARKKYDLAMQLEAKRQFGIPSLPSDTGDCRIDMRPVHAALNVMHEEIKDAQTAYALLVADESKRQFPTQE